jgi:hypothetical protein
VAGAGVAATGAGGVVAGAVFTGAGGVGAGAAAAGLAGAVGGGVPCCPHPLHNAATTTADTTRLINGFMNVSPFIPVLILSFGVADNQKCSDRALQQGGEQLVFQSGVSFEVVEEAPQGVV